MEKDMKWNAYSKNYNYLAEKMKEKGIDLKLLSNLIDSHERLLERKETKAYQSIYQSKHKITQKQFKPLFNNS